MKSYRI